MFSLCYDLVCFFFRIIRLGYNNKPDPLKQLYSQKDIQNSKLMCMQLSKYDSKSHLSMCFYIYFFFLTEKLTWIDL